MKVKEPHHHMITKPFLLFSLNSYLLYCTIVLKGNFVPSFHFLFLAPPPGGLGLLVLAGNLLDHLGLVQGDLQQGIIKQARVTLQPRTIICCSVIR